jgi:hypothetical protein
MIGRMKSHTWNFLSADLYVPYGFLPFLALQKNPATPKSFVVNVSSINLPSKFCPKNGLILPTTVNNPIGDIEKTQRNTSICSFFEKLQARSTTFHPKLADLSPSIVSSKSSYSEPKYDINTTQNITTRR